jgi:cobalt-zinc-cadmium efflux system membrane fusion protein
VTRPTFIPTWAAAGMAAILLALFSLSAPVIAHEGHDHGATAKPADARLAPRFEVRSEDVEIVGVLADKDLLIYVDRASDNGPIQGAQIEVEGPGIKGLPPRWPTGSINYPRPPSPRPANTP